MILVRAAPGYSMGVAIYRSGPFGPVNGHAGWIPGYVSSLRYYADHGIAIAFQVNTDIGMQDDAKKPVQAMEHRLAEIAIASAGRV
jgi:D-alanyl-D-alanine carboxypeptidase